MASSLALLGHHARYAGLYRNQTSYLGQVQPERSQGALMSSTVSCSFAGRIAGNSVVCHNFVRIARFIQICMVNISAAAGVEVPFRLCPFNAHSPTQQPFPSVRHTEERKKTFVRGVLDMDISAQLFKT